MQHTSSLPVATGFRFNEDWTQHRHFDTLTYALKWKSIWRVCHRGFSTPRSPILTQNRLKGFHGSMRRILVGTAMAPASSVGLLSIPSDWWGGGIGSGDVGPERHAASKRCG